MSKTIHFTKMHGIGNDYIYVDTTLNDIKDPAEASKIWSDRHCGIGGDGLVLIGRNKADFTMRIFNADGSEAKMCGNGIRCVARFVREKGYTDKDELTVETLSGVKHLLIDGGGVTVDMGKAEISDDVPAPNEASGTEEQLMAASALPT